MKYDELLGLRKQSQTGLVYKKQYSGDKNSLVVTITT